MRRIIRLIMNVLNVYILSKISNANLNTFFLVIRFNIILKLYTKILIFFKNENNVLFSENLLLKKLKYVLKSSF